MAIPEEQLKTWSNQGGTGNSITAHTAIRNALQAADSPLAGKTFEIFLQGSYRNSTNIRADSDVDVVAQITQVWYRDLSQLSPEQRAAYERTFFPGTYTAMNWRKDVEAALRKKFGNALKADARKALHVVTGPGNMTADVLPAVLFKKYTAFYAQGVEAFDEGVEFADANGNLTINYPKLHIKNGEEKNSAARTKGQYKPSIRMFKNARNWPRSQVPAAPSYFVECLLYNVPDENFNSTFQQTYFNVIKYLLNNPIQYFGCQNGQLPLFGPTATQWNTTDASTFISALARMWDDW